MFMIGKLDVNVIKENSMDKSSVNRRSVQIRGITGLSRKAFCDRYGIPVRTVEDWDAGTRNPPEWILNLLERVVRFDFKKDIDDR